MRLAPVLLALAFLLLPASALGTSQAHFRSPSGNINCRLVATYVDCLVKTDTWPTHPPKPANCDVDWAPAELSMSGQRVSVGSCRGDIGPLCGPSAPDSCTVLRYGASVTVGRVRCSSAASGVTCRRTDGRHVGFRIAREGYKIYR